MKTMTGLGPEPECRTPREPGMLWSWNANTKPVRTALNLRVLCYEDPMYNPKTETVLGRVNPICRSV